MTFVAIFLLSLCLPGLMSQEMTVCSEDGNTTCFESRQICLNDGANEICGNCTAGFIDFSAFNSTKKGCQNITELPWEAFYTYYKPMYRNDSDVSLADRLKELYFRLQYLSEWMSQIPPPAYTLGVNKFSADLERDRRQLAGARASENASADLGFERFQFSQRLLQNIPSEVDWEADGATTYVKDQGRCGCCWAISSMGAVEGSAFVTEGWIQSLSFQQLISCDEENSGCDGGNIVNAMEYAVTNPFGGLASLNSYPYEDAEGSTTEQCQTQGKNVSVEVYRPSVVVTYSDSDSLTERIQKMKSAAARQPVSVALASNCDTLSSYSGGVITDDRDCACQAVSCIDHAVLLVGYSDKHSPPYWKLKNS